MESFDLIVIGGGPGGYTAALYAARAGRSVLVLERLSPGGQMALTSEIDNYPGFPEGVDGFELVQSVRSINKTIPILLMTARDGIAAKQRGLARPPLGNRPRGSRLSPLQTEGGICVFY